jgi:hypothetical protein
LADGFEHHRELLIRAGLLAPNAKLRSWVVPAWVQQQTTGEGDCQHEHGNWVHMSWKRVLERVFYIDIERCACGGKLTLVAVIEEPAVLVKIQTHLGLSPHPPPREWARWEAAELPEPPPSGWPRYSARVREAGDYRVTPKCSPCTPLDSSVT